MTGFQHPKEKPGRRFAFTKYCNYYFVVIESYAQLCTDPRGRTADVSYDYVGDA
jgi:hypothetical protein